MGSTRPESARLIEVSDDFGQHASRTTAVGERESSFMYVYVRADLRSTVQLNALLIGRLHMSIQYHPVEILTRTDFHGLAL